MKNLIIRWICKIFLKLNTKRGVKLGKVKPLTEYSKHNPPQLGSRSDEFSDQFYIPSIAVGLLKSTLKDKNVAIINNKPYIEKESIKFWIDEKDNN